MATGDSSVETERRGLIRAPQNFVAGLCLMMGGAFALWATSNLPQGTLRAMGPAMLPRWLAIAVLICGIALTVASFLQDGTALDRWALRGPLFVGAGAVAFALTIRLFGLAVAGPLAIVISGFASSETRFKEILIFAVVMTAFCIGLFRYALNQPMPVLIIPGVIQI